MLLDDDEPAPPTACQTSPAAPDLAFVRHQPTLPDAQLQQQQAPPQHTDSLTAPAATAPRSEAQQHQPPQVIKAAALLDAPDTPTSLPAVQPQSPWNFALGGPWHAAPWSCETPTSSTAGAHEAYNVYDDDELAPLKTQLPSTPSLRTALRGRSGWPVVRISRTVVDRVWHSGILIMMLASLTFAISAFVVKLLHGHIPVFEVVVVRSGLSLAVCLLWARAAGISPLLGQRRHLGLLLLRGVFGAASQSLSYFCIDRLPLADSATIIFLNPALTALAAWVIMRERLGPLGIGGVLVSLVGLVLLTQPTFIFGGPTWTDTQFMGTAFGLAAAMTTAAAIITLRIIGSRESALVMSVYFHGCSLLMSVVPLATGFPRGVVAPNAVQWVFLLLIAATSLVAQLMFTRALQLITATSASALNFTQVVYSYAFALLFLHETITLLGVGGSVLLSGGVIMVSSRNSKGAPAAADTAAAVAGEPETPVKPLESTCELSSVVALGAPPQPVGESDVPVLAVAANMDGTWLDEDEVGGAAEGGEGERHSLLAAVRSGTT